MAEAMAKNHDPNQKLRNAYKEWAKGGWGMILTGQEPKINLSQVHNLQSL